MLGQRLVDDHALAQTGDELIKHINGHAAVGFFPAAQQDLHAHLMALVQELLGQVDPELQIMLADFEGQTEAFDVEFFLLSARLALGFFELVLVSAKVKQFADGRIGGWRHFNQVETALGGEAERFTGRHDADLGIALINQADLGDANEMVDPETLLNLKLG